MQENTFSTHAFEECMKCTVCTAYCPVVPVNPAFPGPKQAGPDGERFRLKNKLFFDDNLKYCMNCKRCEVACPSGVRIGDIIQAARQRYTHQAPSLRNRILANTDRMGKLARPAAPAVNALIRTPLARTSLDRVLGIDAHRTFPAYVRHGFIRWFRREAAARQDRYPLQVSFFHGCSTEFQHPEVGQALVEVLNAVGVGVRLLDERCCGVAMIANGLFKAARRNARHNVRALAATDGPVVTVSSTCTLTLRDEYPSVLEIDNAAVRERVVLVEKFLYDLLEAGRIRLVFKEGYHARAASHVPCHMLRLGWSVFTRQLLERIPGLELIPLPSQCCGIAGTYGFKKENFAASQAIGQPLFDAIASVDPDFVACECETCKWQIEMSTGYKVLNPIVVLHEALDLEATARANGMADD